MIFQRFFVPLLQPIFAVILRCICGVFAVIVLFVFRDNNGITARFSDTLFKGSEMSGFKGSEMSGSP